MALQFDVRLRGGTPEGDLLRFAPGDEVAGTAEIVSDGDFSCNKVYLRLQWHTEGRGDRDEGTVEQIDVFGSGKATLAAGVPVTQDFRFRLPNEPWSYDGHYISIVWAIQIQFDVSFARDVMHHHPFVVVPTD